MTAAPLKVLIVEDCPADADLMALHLEREGFRLSWKRVETEEAYKTALEEPYDLILSDWSLPQFNGLSALRLMQERGIDAPFILISGGIGEETAVAAMRQGAADYILKDRMDRLGQAVKNALENKRLKDENKKITEALKASEAELRGLFASMQDLVAVVDLEGICQKIAPTQPSFLSQPASRLLGKSVQEVFPLNLALEFKRTIREVLETQQTRRIERELLIEGKSTWIEATVAPLSKREVIWVARDVSERKRAQAQIQLQAAALAAAANAIVITNNQGAIEWINPAFTVLTGYTANEALGQKSSLLKSGVQERSFYQNLWDVILSGQIWRGELVNKRKDGSLYHEELTITPLLDSEGRITHFIGVKQDITARKKFEASLQRYALRQEKIAALGRSLAAEFDLEAIYRVAEIHIQNMIDCPNFGFSLFDPRQKTLKVVYLSSDGVRLDVNAIPPLKIDPQNPAGGRLKAIVYQQPEFVNNLATKRKTAGGLLIGSEREPQSACYIPMLAEGQVIGLMELQSYREDAYTPEDGEWLSVVANQIAMAIKNANLFSEIQQRVSELSAVAAINSAVISHLEPLKIYATILEQLKACLEVDAAAIFLFEAQNQTLQCVAENGYRYNSPLQMRLQLGESLAGQTALERKLFYADLKDPQTNSLLKGVTKAEYFQDYYAIPLLVDTKLIGVLEILHRSRLAPNENWLRFFEILANQTAIALNTIQLYDDIRTSHSELLKAYDLTIEGWSRAMDLRDKETENHTRRVTEMTIRLAQHFGLSEEQLVHIRRGALLHDIGKLGVPDRILMKASSLTEEEWHIMRSHPQLAYDMLYDIEYLRPALDIPYCHHEKWDGSGYPRGLQGEQIPFAARLFALVDVYDALTSHRPYRKAWSHHQALEYIQEQSGKHFDPQVVKAFFSLLQTGELKRLIK